MSSKRPVWEPAPTRSQPSPFCSSPATQYGRILVKQNYDYHYKWVGKAAASTDCKLGETAIHQLAFLKAKERWKPSKEHQMNKQIADQWMDTQIRRATPAIDTKVGPHVERYAAFRRANPTGRPTIVERYVQKKLKKNHIDNLRNMTSAIDTSPPARAMQYHEQCKRQPYTRTGVLKRPVSQQSSRPKINRAALQQSNPAANLSPKQCLPSRRPGTADATGEASGKRITRKRVASGRRSTPDTVHVPIETLGQMRNRGLMRSAGSDGVHLPISAARDVMEGHARQVGGERYNQFERDSQGTTTGVAVRKSLDNADGVRACTPAALEAQRQWMATGVNKGKSLSRSPDRREPQEDDMGWDDSLMMHPRDDASTRDESEEPLEKSGFEEEDVLDVVEDIPEE